MVVVTQGPMCWDPARVKLYRMKDPAMGNLPILVFYGPSTTANTVLNSSRIQAHIISVAGLRSYDRLTIAPTSPLYEAVRYLPTEKQGDEINRGLAISIFKYFGEIPTQICEKLSADAVLAGYPVLFNAAHAARVTTHLVESNDAAKATLHIQAAMVERHMSWVDVDVMVSNEVAKQLKDLSKSASADQGLSVSSRTTDSIMEFLSGLGAPAFMPTSKLRRAPSRPTSFAKNKSLSSTEVEALHREMMEATETEVTYVKKLQELDQLFALTDSCTERSAVHDYAEVSQDQKKSTQLLMNTLREIARLNNEFLNAIVDIMDETSSHSNFGQPNAATPGRHDITGAEAFAKVLLLFLPRFSQPYQQYLKLSPQIPRIITTSVELGINEITSAMAQIGEQRLKSWLIEPVQRLPRYTLFVDKMIGLLPSSHPSVNKFLRAKDLIAGICALDGEDADTERLTLQRLGELVQHWPTEPGPVGRMITAVDAFELQAPYSTDTRDVIGASCILLVFPHMIIELQKCPGTTLSARGLLAELQRPNQAPTTIEPEANASNVHQYFACTSVFPIENTTTTESPTGRDIFFTVTKQVDHKHQRREIDRGYGIIFKAYRLQGSYEGKAMRVAEEIARARIEGRFSENIRDGPVWTFHTLHPDQHNIGLALAIYDPNVPTGDDFQIRGSGTILIDARMHLKIGHNLANKPFPYHKEPHFKLMTADQDVLRLEGVTPNGRKFIDQTSSRDMVQQLLSRVTQMIGNCLEPTTGDAVQQKLAYNTVVLNGLSQIARLSSTSSRIKLRPLSPVKALSSILGSSTKLSQYLNSAQSDLDTPPTPSPINYPSSNTHCSGNDEITKSKFTVVSSTDTPVSGSMLQLETTYNTYIVALHCRAGNIIGRSLRNRETADELMVNELYNTLIEDPSQHQAAAEVPVHVLFAAFEKFVSHEWKDRMGEVLPLKVLEAMQSAFDRSSPSELARNIKALLSELTPQNYRIFSATVKLLFDLLEASSNDADRGALTASFAEALVLDSDPHQFIPLLDRLVDDVDTFFDDVGQMGVPLQPQMLQASSMDQWSRSTNAGSISSNGSSLKKRFGFGKLSRESSKHDCEPRRNHMWRTLSNKSAGNADGSGPGSVMGFFRSKSSERVGQHGSSSRPGSAQSVLSTNESPSLNFDSLRGKHTIAESYIESPSRASVTRRPKRRSSLSDLQDLEGCTSPFDSGSPLHKRSPQRQDIPNANVVASTPSNTTVPGFPTRSKTLMKKDTCTPVSRATDSGNSNVLQRRDRVKPAPSARTEEASGQKRMPLQERTVVNDNPQHPPMRTPSALRGASKLHSPEKVRERIERETSAAKHTGSQLQAKMLELRNDLQRKDDTTAEWQRLESRLCALECMLSDSQRETQQRLATMQSNVDTTLAASEQKCKTLDKAYQAAHVENELLYERFNAELAKVFQSVQVEGMDVATAKLRETQNEVTRLKKENFRLKRENMNMKIPAER